MILDFSSPIDYLWALLPEVILAATGLLVLTLDVFQRGDRSGPSRAWVRWTAVAGVLLALVANGYLLEFEVPVRSGMIAMDSFRVATNFVILGATVLGLLFSFDYLRRERPGCRRVLLPHADGGRRDDAPRGLPRSHRGVRRGRVDVPLRVCPDGIQPERSQVGRGRPQVLPHGCFRERVPALWDRAACSGRRAARTWRS